MLEILLASIGAVLFLKFIIGVVLICYCLRSDRNCEIKLGKGGKLVMFKGGPTVPTSKEMLEGLRRIRKRDIVGEGGYGVVYKMVLKDQRTFAVKRLKQCLEATRGFDSEVETLGEIYHCNLVKLRGYCAASAANVLFYDFIPNGNLSQLLHSLAEEGKVIPVDWAIRVKIARGVARALAYLHFGCSPRIIHRDVSSSNVLLGDNFEPYLSDFGLAKLMSNNETHVTVTVGGTFGYMAPEYARSGHATEKSDVYSYGVLLLELLSRLKPTDSSISEEHLNLSTWVRKLHENNMEFEVVDKSIRDTANHQEVAIMMEIACSCISQAPEERPDMYKVVQMLDSLVDPDSTASLFTSSTTPSDSIRSSVNEN